LKFNQSTRAIRFVFNNLAESQPNRSKIQSNTSYNCFRFVSNHLRFRPYFQFVSKHLHFRSDFRLVSNHLRFRPYFQFVSKRFRFRLDLQFVSKHFRFRLSFRFGSVFFLILKRTSILFVFNHLLHKA
jgi:hypothetical protein